MPMIAVIADTPYYVLMDGNRRIGPPVVQLHSGTECAPIYGFSDKVCYDKFLMNSELALRPYPLVKRYLRNQAGAPGDGLKLVVIDAVGPRAPYLHAATMEAVLEAHEKRTNHVSAMHHLMFDQEANAYRVEDETEYLE